MLNGTGTKERTDDQTTGTIGSKDNSTVTERPKTDGDLANDDTEASTLSRLRLSQNFAQSIGVRKALLTVPVRKPTRQEFVRVHPDAGYHMPSAVIELRDEGEIYAVEQGICAELPGEVIPKILFTAMTRQGVIFLWPIRLPGEDGALDPWNRSALEAADLATQQWIKVVSNRALGAYEVFKATGNLSDPEWPEVSFAELVRVAFKGRVIGTLDHPVLRRLRGEV